MDRVSHLHWKPVTNFTSLDILIEELLVSGQISPEVHTII